MDLNTAIADDGSDDDETVVDVSTATPTGKAENLLDYLERVQLAQKIIDISVSQTNLPQRLKDDAAQEIRIMWMSRIPDQKRFEQAQIASYAHRIAKHAALRCRRELGSAVRLPGSAFRKRKDGTTYVQPGTIARPLDWDEMDEWFNLEDQPDASLTTSCGADGIGGFIMPDGGGNSENLYLGSDLSPVIHEGLDTMELADAAEVPLDAALVVGGDAEDERRLEEFNRLAHKLNPRARAIVSRLVAGESLHQIQAAMNISPGIVTREIRKAVTELNGILPEGLTE